MGFSNTRLLISLQIALLVLANKVVSQGDTTAFYYNSFSSRPDSLIFQGDAFIHPSSPPVVRLTRVDPSSGEPATQSVGRVVYAPPVKLWDVGRQAWFHTILWFTITPSRTSPNLPGEGLTFFIVPVNSTIPPGSTGGNLGIINPRTGISHSLFAVEFDTFSNPWDPSYPHIGININSRVSSNVSAFPVVAQEVTAQIHYDSSTRAISVVATYGSQTSTVTHVFDLKTILPKEVQVGVSASTGQFTSRSVAFHDLRSWHFASSLVSDVDIPATI